MDKEEENKTTEPVYPDVTRGSFSDDHSNYATPKEFAGGDIDKDNTKYFVAFVIFISVLFIFAVKSLSGEDFFF